MRYAWGPRVVCKDVVRMTQHSADPKLLPAAVRIPVIIAVVILFFVSHYLWLEHGLEDVPRTPVEEQKKAKIDRLKKQAEEMSKRQKKREDAQKQQVQDLAKGAKICFEVKVRKYGVQRSLATFYFNSPEYFKTWTRLPDKVIVAFHVVKKGVPATTKLRVEFPASKTTSARTNEYLPNFAPGDKLELFLLGYEPQLDPRSPPKERQLALKVSASEAVKVSP